MIKKSAFIIVVLFLLSAETVSAEKILSVSLYVYKNDSVAEERIKVEEDGPTFYIQPGDYRLVIADSKGNTLYNKSTNLVFAILSDPPRPQDYAILHLKIGYSEDMHEIKLYKIDKLIYNTSINQCILNGICEPHETYLSCPKDCTVDKKDGTCTPKTDPDCTKTSEPHKKTEEWWIYPVFIILLASITYIIHRIREERYIKKKREEFEKLRNT